MTLFVLFLVILCCALDAYTTDCLLDRGGYEKVSAWVIGEYPEPWLVWAWVFVFPAVVASFVLYRVPEVWPVGLVLAALKLGLAIRNHRLMR